MKKISLFLSALLVITTLSGCIEFGKPKTPDLPDKPDSDDVSVELPDGDKDADAVKPDNTGEKEEEKEDLGFITLSKCQRLMQEWGEERPLWEVIWHNMRLSEEDAKEYPHLWEYFEKKNTDNDAAAFETKEDFVKQIENSESYYMAAYLRSSTDYFVQRADKTIVSILSEYEDYTGGAHGYYAKAGYNIDPKTGNDVDISAVITDTDALYKLIFDGLLKSAPEEIKEERREELYNYFAEGLNWSIDYQKLTVYFVPYEIASYAAGLMEIEIWFDEYPELFNEQYTKAPSSYAIELSRFESHTFDIDEADGKRDALSVGCYPFGDEYECGELFIDINGNSYKEEEVYGTSLTPFIVCVDGKYYVYAEIGEFDGSNAIHVFEVKKDGIKKIDEIALGFKKLWDYSMIDFGGYYREIINDPDNMHLESYFHLLETRNTAYKSYYANKTTGIPETKGDIYKINEDNYKKRTLCDVPVVFAKDGKMGIIPEDTEFTLMYTDCETFVDCALDDGGGFRITVEKTDMGNLVGGIGVYECFTDVMPDYGFGETELPDYDTDAKLAVPYVYYEEEYENEDGDIVPASKIELLQIVADEENSAANDINAEISELYKEYLYNYAYSDEQWCDFLAWPTETDRYLNAVITHISYPTYGTNGKVSSWVYDKKTGNRYTLDEALADAGVTRESLLSEFKDSVSYWGGKAVGIDTLAFRMLQDGKIQFLAGVQLEYAPDDTWIYYMTRTDEGITNWDSVPFDPKEVTGEYADTPLYCQTLATTSQFDGGENEYTLSFEAACETLSDVAEVKEALESGRILVLDDKMGSVTLNDAPHICIAFGLQYGDYFEKERIFAVAPGSVYEYDTAFKVWNPVGLG